MGRGRRKNKKGKKKKEKTKEASKLAQTYPLAVTQTGDSMQVRRLLFGPPIAFYFS